MWRICSLTVDSLIVGNYLGSQALAAVSSSGNLIYLLVGFFQGISMGGGVIISRYFGAKNYDGLEKSIHVSIGFGIIASVLLTLVGFFFAPVILTLMNTPLSVLPDSITYFQIYFLGSFGFVMYNIFVGILQAVGDSKTPLIYLIISSVINIVLDLIFIGFLHYGVGAAALATIISQFISAFLCFFKLSFTKQVYKVRLSSIRLEKEMLLQIFSIGIPAGFQNSIISFANIVVQSNINGFGELAMAGCGAYSKIEGFMMLPVTSFTLALTTFVSQNIGANKMDRVKKGAKFGILCSMILAQFIGVLTYFFAPYLISLFDTTPEVIILGTGRAQASALFFFLAAYSHCVGAILRGAGNSKTPMVVLFLSWCLLRVSILVLLKPIFPTIDLVYWVYPITWAFSSVLFYYFYQTRIDLAK